ncbi:MAG: S1 RNA-binding domain-containing protein [Candidatus Heimdallarchaeota archaeon]|nr:S1 RNA-binding domain-containing protein [Candidatus Heimdallarchaeota archaeon]
MDSKFPAVGELVIGNCSKVTPHGAYFEIFDYESLGAEAGFVHISELSRTWVRNIRSQVREGQRVVAKILRVDERRGEIDMSIRRVSEPQRRSKMTDLKLENRARGIIAIACEKTESKLESIEKILLAEYGSIYEALLTLRETDAKFLTKIEIPADVSEVLYEIAVKELQPPTVRLQGVISLTCYESDGSVILSDFFKKYKNIFKKKHKDSEIALQVISSPLYRCTIESPDWKAAESDWKGLQKEIHDYFRSVDIELSFERK